MADSLLVPIREVAPQLDNDNPGYMPSSPATYLVLALCHETLAGPGTMPSLNGIPAPDFSVMRPRLARSWWPESDGSWVVQLRDGVYSNVGNPLTASLVHWGFERSFALENIGSWRWGQVGGLDGPESVEIMDTQHLRFRLRRPDALFPAHLFWATPRINDATAAIAGASDNDPWSCDWMAENTAGFGEFELSSSDSNRLRFTANRDRSANNSLQIVTVEKVSSRLDALNLLGEKLPVFVPGLRCDEVREIEDRDEINLIGAWAGHASIEIDYNTPPFDDYRVRYALSYATPYDSVIQDGFLGLARRWQSPLKTYSPLYSSEAWKFETDIVQARTLLEAAGYTNGLVVPLHMRLRPDTERIAGILQKEYGKVGIQLEIHDYAASALSNAPGWMPPLYLRVDCGHNTTQPLYDLAHDYAPVSPIISENPSPGVCTWHPPYAGSRVFEQMMRDALLAPDMHSRSQRILNLQRSIVEFAPAVFLAEQALFNAVNGSVSDWVCDYEHRLNQVVLFQNANSNYIGP